MKNTVENNKLIAQFMDICPDEDNGYYFVELDGFNDMFEADELQFERSWDWLMPVVEKIESLNDFRVNINIENGINVVISERIGRSIANSYLHFNPKVTGNKKTTLMENIYYSVVEFIKWYNDQNQS